MLTRMGEEIRRRLMADQDFVVEVKTECRIEEILAALAIMADDHAKKMIFLKLNELLNKGNVCYIHFFHYKQFRIMDTMPKINGRNKVLTEAVLLKATGI